MDHLNMHMCKIMKCTDLSDRGAYYPMRLRVRQTKAGRRGIRMHRNLDGISPLRTIS